MANNLTGRISSRLILGLALPLFALSLFDRAYLYINMACLGRLGASALAAVTIANVYTVIVGSMTGGFNRSVLHFVSHEAGRRDYEAASRWLSRAFAWAVLNGIFFSAVLYTFRRPMVAFMSGDAGVVSQAMEYFGIMAFFPVFNFPRNAILASLRGDGDTRTPMKIGACQSMLTAFLDITLIFGFLGFPRLGIRGAAVATLISQAAALTALVAFSRRPQSKIRLKAAFLKGSFEIEFLRRFFRHLAPSMGDALVRGCNRFFIVKIISPFGAPALVAFRVAESLSGFFQMAGGQSISAACGAIAGQNFGAGRPENVKRALLLSSELYLFAAIPGIILFNAFPQFFIGLFIKDATVIGEASVYLRFLSISLLLAGFVSAGQGVLNVGGLAGAVMLMSIMGNYLVQIPAAYFLSRFTPLGINGIWLADPLTYFVQAAATLWLLNRRFFTHSPIQIRPDLMRIHSFSNEGE
jgi:putative MATE family efflux protein